MNQLWIAATLLVVLVCARGGAAGEEPTTVPVLAEGVGRTADEALKNALRAAVAQVVGTLVETDTLVKNDAVVSDKVLTASSGYVVSYERLRLKQEGGLVRVQLNAKVQRTVLIDKLRELKITLRPVNPGRVLPAEADRRFSDARVKALTKEEMLANKTEILQDALMDLPKVLEARARTPDRFDFDAATSTLKVEVLVQPDNDRYVQFLKRLQMRLDKIALNKKLIAVADGAAADLHGWGYRDTNNGVLRGFTASCPALSSTDLRGAPDAWILWMLTDFFKGGASTRWVGYVLDTDPRKSIVGLHGELQVQVALRDADGKVLTEETFEPREHHAGSFWLGNVTHRRKDGDTWWTGGFAVGTPLAPAVKVTQEMTVNVVLAPLPVLPRWGNQTGDKSIQYVLVRPYPRTIRLSQEEMQRVKDIRCGVLFRPAKGG